jgi:hypothetical protein
MSDQLDLNDHELMAVNGLTQYEKETYKEIGKEMFGHLKFKGVKLINATKPSDDELTAYISQQLNDGIHPSMLDEGEHEVMLLNLGSEWYIKWGYIEADLTDIVTVDRN